MVFSISEKRIVSAACFCGGYAPLVTWNAIYLSEGYLGEILGPKVLSYCGAAQNVPSLLVLLFLIARAKSKRTSGSPGGYPRVLTLCWSLQLAISISFPALLCIAGRHLSNGGAIAVLFALIVAHGAATGLASGRAAAMAGEFPGNESGTLVAGAAAGAMIPAAVSLTFGRVRFVSDPERLIFMFALCGVLQVAAIVVLRAASGTQRFNTFAGYRDDDGGGVGGGSGSDGKQPLLSDGVDRAQPAAAGNPGAAVPEVVEARIERAAYGDALREGGACGPPQARYCTPPHLKSIPLDLDADAAEQLMSWFPSEHPYLPMHIPRHPKFVHYAAGAFATMIVSLSLLSAAPAVPAGRLGADLSLFLIIAYFAGDLVGRAAATRFTAPGPAALAIVAVRAAAFIPTVILFSAGRFLRGTDAFAIALYFLLAATGGYCLVSLCEAAQKVCGFGSHPCPVVGSIMTASIQIGLVAGLGASFGVFAAVEGLQ